jgi:hypothetical protein
MLPKLNLFFTSRKTQKQVKFIAFSLKIGPCFHPSSTFFSQKNHNKTFYVDMPEMLKFNPKISIQKYPIFCSW